MILVTAEKMQHVIDLYSVQGEQHGTTASNNRPGNGTATGDNHRLDVWAYLSKYGVECMGEKQHGSSTLYLLKHCIFDPSHKGGEAAIGQTSDGKLFYQCFHNSCQDHTWPEAREIISGDDPLFDKPAGTRENTDRSSVSKQGGEAVHQKKVTVIPCSDFLRMDFPPRETLLEPWLPAQGLALIHAYRGVGKTQVSVGIAAAVATGSTFLRWKAPRPAGVLFIDGEMPGIVLQRRIAEAIAGMDGDGEAMFNIITPDLQEFGIPDLATIEGQDRLEPYITDDLKLIIVDNISTVCRSTHENKGDSWLPVQDWALKMRARGVSVVLVHHDGKGGQQRGTSRKEDVLDTVIQLKHPADYQPDQGATFEVYFKKARGIFGQDVQPFEAQLISDSDENMKWVTRTLEDSIKEKVRRLFDEGYKQAHIAQELGITPGYVSQIVKKIKLNNSKK